MKNKLFLMITISAFGISFAGCSASFSTGNNSSSAVKPTNTASSPAANKPANSASTSNSTAKTEKPKTALQDEKKPEGKAKTAGKNVPVPDSWVYVYDEAKGYGFSVPEGTTGSSETQEGVDTFVAETPAPSEIGVIVISFKDKEMSKEDLLDVAVKFMEGLGAIKVDTGKLTEESENYSLAEVTATLADGSKSKSKILVGTDVTDNYVMIVGAEEPKFAANEKVIDEIWGSFEMWSGKN